MGAEAILLPPGVPDGAWFLLRLPVRGIFHVVGDGEEKTHPTKKIFLASALGQRRSPFELVQQRKLEEYQSLQV